MTGIHFHASAEGTFKTAASALEPLGPTHRPLISRNAARFRSTLLFEALVYTGNRRIGEVQECLGPGKSRRGRLELGLGLSTASLAVLAWGLQDLRSCLFGGLPRELRWQSSQTTTTSQIRSKM